MIRKVWSRSQGSPNRQAARLDHKLLRDCPQRVLQTTASTFHLEYCCLSKREPPMLSRFRMSECEWISLYSRSHEHCMRNTRPPHRTRPGRSRVKSLHLKCLLKRSSGNYYIHRIPKSAEHRSAPRNFMSTDRDLIEKAPRR